jgi:hypothetical protein
MSALTENEHNAKIIEAIANIISEYEDNPPEVIHFINEVNGGVQHH